MLNFEIRYTKALVILCILAVIFIGLSFVLPIEYSYENHFLENLEVVILFLGIVICIGKIRDFVLCSFDNNLYIDDWQRIELGPCILSYWYR